jgi:hypothetical protein
MKIEQLAYHRNGVCGQGFWTAIYTHDDAPGRFLATVFPQRGNCAVINLDLIADYGVTFGQNSWRGDTHETDLRAAIAIEETKPYVAINLNIT